MTSVLPKWARSSRDSATEDRLWKFETRITEAITAGRIDRPVQNSSDVEWWVGAGDHGQGEGVARLNSDPLLGGLPHDETSDTPLDVAPSERGKASSGYDTPMKPTSPPTSGVSAELAEVSLVDLGAAEEPDMDTYNIVSDLEEELEGPGSNPLISSDSVCDVCARASENLSTELLTDFYSEYQLCWDCTVCNSLWKADRDPATMTSRDKSIWADRTSPGPNGVGAIEAMTRASTKAYNDAIPVARCIKDLADHASRMPDF